MRSPRFILASASPRRLELLRRLGIRAEALPSSVVELERPDEPAVDFVSRLAEEKGRDVAARVVHGPAPYVLLAADTAVVLDGRAMGKPRDADDARAMLRDLRGREHEVITGVFVLRGDDGRGASFHETTRVRFRDYPDSTIEGYVATGEPMDKAGAYGIQGAGAALAEEVHGSFFNVVGLPIERLAGWLARLDLRLDDLLFAVDE
ncbi:MAG: septum formation protein Maf [bacterium]|nr:septum formation protein Maf [bacterium]